MARRGLGSVGGRVHTGGMNWFASGGAEYARARPDYPPELAGYLRSLVTTSGASCRAVDIGCGTGQFTVQLAAELPAVIGVDPSIDQLAHAPQPAGGAGRVAYVCAEAERLPLADGCAALITAAQSAHWFDLPRFWDEVRRVAADGAVIALVTYGALTLGPWSGAGAETEPEHGTPREGGTDAAAVRFEHFYRTELGDYWPPERAMIESGYAEMEFPFSEFDSPPMVIRRRWALADLLGYVRSWSAVRNLRSQGHEEILERFARELGGLWSPHEATREVEWPITLRVARVA